MDSRIEQTVNYWRSRDYYEDMYRQLGTPEEFKEFVLGDTLLKEPADIDEARKAHAEKVTRGYGEEAQS